MTIDWSERRFFDRLASLLGSRMLEFRRMGTQVVYLSLEDGRELVHKETPRQELSLWRPGRPWTELIWIDFLASEGLAVPKLVAADIEHGWLVEEFVRGALLSEGVNGPAFERLLDSLLGVESACEAAPADVRAFSFPGAEADVQDEQRRVARWLRGDVHRQLDRLVREAFSGARPTMGPLDVRPENAIDTSDKVVLIDFATVGADYTERRLAGYLWTALPQPRSFLTPQAYRLVEQRLGRKAALRLAFFDFAHCARALDRWAYSIQRRENGIIKGRDIPERLEEEWRKPRIDNAIVVALQGGLGSGRALEC